MKNHPYLNLFCVLAALAIGLSIGAATQERIRWKWHDSTVLLTMQSNEHGKVEFGLRNDGVVVWREIMPATTNSPAEQAEMAITGTNYWFTNGIFTPTNWLKPEWTNILIKPLYFHRRGPNGEWTNWEEGARWWSNQIKPFPGVILTNELYWNIGTNNFIPLHTVTPWSKTEKEYLTNETYYGK